MGAAREQHPAESSGIPFDAGNDSFRAARNYCAAACREFNAIPEDAPAALRVRAWRNIVDPARVRGSRSESDDDALSSTAEVAFSNSACVPRAPFIKPPIRIDYGLRVHIAPTAFVNHNCIITDTPLADVRIGEHCNLGPNVAIYAVSHPLEVNDASKRASLGSSVVIEDCVWIGGSSLIFGGVTIGKHAVIGAGSVVTRDVPPFSVARGNPARIVDFVSEQRYKEDPDTLRTLQDALLLGRPEEEDQASRTVKYIQEWAQERKKSWDDKAKEN